MKVAFILIALTTTFQVSLAANITSNNSSTIGAPTTLPSYYDRRYQLFDAILTYKNRLLANEFITSTANVRDILNDYNRWLLHHNTTSRKKSKLFQDFKENLENFTQTIATFTNDSHNCDLQRRVQSELYAVQHVCGELHNKQINQIWDKHYVRYIDDVENYDFKLLTSDVERFLGSLSGNAEWEENEELVEWCQEFLSTEDPEDKRVAFKLIRNLYAEELERETQAGHPNCQLVAQMEWKLRWKELRLQMYTNQLKDLDKQIKKALDLKKSLHKVIDLYKNEDKTFMRGLMVFGLLH